MVVLLRPESNLAMLWSAELDQAEWLADVEPLHLEHTAARQAATELPRMLAD